MGELRLPGLATGLDTNTIIQQLMEVNSRRLKMMQQDLQATEQKKEAFSGLYSKLKTFDQTASALADSSQLKSYQAVTGDSDVVTAEASSSAAEGNHSIEIKQLATSERWIHSGFANKTNYVGAGKFILSYNNEEIVLQTTEDTTLEDFVGLINGDPDNPGVNASLLKYDDGSGTPWRLVLSGKDSGSDYQIRINSSNTELWKADSSLLKDGENAAAATRLQDLDSFVGTGMESGSTPDQLHITGMQHDGTTPVDVYVDLTQHTTVQDMVDAITDAFGGTATATYSEGMIRVTDNTSGVSGMTVAVSFVPGTGSSASLTLPALQQSTVGGSEAATLASLAPAQFSEIQAAQDSEFRVDGFPSGAWISRSSNTVDDVISGVTLHLHASSEDSSEADGYKSIDINLTRDTESLKEKVKAMVDSFNATVMFLQENTKFEADGKSRGILATDYSVSTIWNKMKEPFQNNTRGFSTDDSFDHPNDIGLKLGADGLLEFDEGDFDEAIVDDYRGVLELMGALKTGASNSDDIKFYAANKGTTAGIYEVRVYGNGSEVTSAQIKLLSETTWRDMTVAGSELIMGDSSLDSRNNPLHPESNLQLTVDASATSATAITAIIRIKQGFAGAAEDTLDTMLDSFDGSVPISQQALEDQIKSQNDQIEREEARLERMEERLIAQYARMEKTLQQISSQMSALNSL